MTDFASRLRAQKKALEAEKRTQDEERASESAARQKILEEQVELLRSVVMPVLNDCQRELQAEGMDLRVDEEFDVQNYMVPRNAALKISCGSPARRSDGYRFESRPLFVEVQDDQFGIEIGEKHARRPSKSITRVSRDEVEDKIQESVLELTGEALKEWQSSPARDV
ncbi:hypothetical protein [Paracoccus isoporae]|uniref:hypothetical protein n=1 Tax=Paracoccus isoporae TaxID=591205 RepID=UPI00115FAB6A|nr:hypothetical protein [Paracoccus isoporae]